MKNKNGRGRRVLHISASTGLTVLVLAFVLVLNIAVTALFSGNLWYVDLTPGGAYNVYHEKKTERKYAQMYTLMDETVSYVDYVINEANRRRAEAGEEDVEVKIIFCAAPDILKRNDSMRYVYYTALSLEKEFPETIQVSWRDVWSNPSSVDEYRSTAYANIYQSNIIVASGTEYRISSLRSYYTYDSESDMSTPVAYNGQKVFAQQILDVTGAEAPIVCLTTNHDEVFKMEGYELENRGKWPEYNEFLNVLEGAGYEVRYLNLETQEIPENCRLILSFDPQTDFLASSYKENGKDGGENKVSEVLKLNDFLEEAYSFMVFTDADTPVLPNLEEMLEFWGIELMHYEDKNTEANYLVKDYANRLNGEGTIFSAEYAKGKGVGSAVIADIVNAGTMPQIIFENARPMRFADTFENRYIMANEKTGAEAYSYAFSEVDRDIRAAFDMFLAGSDDADASVSAVLNGKPLTDKNGDPLGVGAGVYKVMTLSAETRTVGEGMGYSNIDRTSYVCSVGSTAMAKDEILGTTAYGNTDVLLATLRYIGKAVNPVGLSFVPMHIPTMDLTVSDTQTGTEYALYTQEDLTKTTTALILIPFLTVLTSGVVVLVRRRARHG